MSSGVFSLGRFARRHIGPQPADIEEMLSVVGAESLDALIDETVPADIRLNKSLDLPAAKTEEEALAELASIIGENRIFQSCIGMGYSAGILRPGILRNVLESPGWYTAYTP